MKIRVETEENAVIADGACLSCVDLGVYGKSRTVQHHRESCDIASIVAKYKKTGILPQFRSQTVPGRFDDFSDVQDYQQACNRVIAAQQAFSELPVRVRERFSHDPAELLTFLADSSNRDEAIALGLIAVPAADDALSVKKAGDVAAADAKSV